MKAGTTWLYAVLARHPELHFTPEKEIHYFYSRYVDSKLLDDTARLRNAKDKYIPSINPEMSSVDRVRLNMRWVASYLDRPVDDFWYRNLFDLQRGQVYACDFSNLTSQIPAKAWPRIEKDCDRLRVLYTMRDPIKRLWSHTKFHLQVTGKVSVLDEWNPEQFNIFVRKPFIWENAEYGRVLRNLRTGLTEGSWKAIFYEDLHADQSGALRDIEDFLGISHHNYPEDIMSRRFTESVSKEMPSFFPDLFAEDVKRIRDEVAVEGFDLPASWS